MRSCPVFVGRDLELGALEARLGDCVGTGSVGVVLVRGEAGIGKTRIIEEFGQRTSLPVLRVLCSELGRSLPFGALADALRAIGHDIDLQDERSGAGMAAAAARAEAKARLHRSLVDSLAASSWAPEGDARLLVVEDLHWADDATLEWLPHLAATAVGPMLVVLTAREERTDIAFLRCLAEIERLRTASDVHVGPMPRDDVLRLVRLMEAPSSTNGEEIADLADGNPLFAEELASFAPGERVQWDQSSPLPRIVQLTFAQRSGQLTGDARALMCTAAAWGREFASEQLSAFGDGLVKDVSTAADELVAAGLVVEQEPGWFAFRHALVRAAAYESMSPAQRTAVHRAIAVALEAGLAGRPEVRAAELVHHWSLAADAERMEVWAAAACERALLAHSPAAAGAHATHAIDQLVRLRGEAPHELLRHRGVAHSWLGQFESARADQEAALRVARAAGDLRQQWRSLVDLGELAIEEDFGRAGALLDAALGLVRGLDDDRGLAETLGLVGFWHMMEGDPKVALGYQTEALAILDALGDERAVGEILDLMGWTSYVNADLPASRDAYRRGVGLNRAIGAAQNLASCQVGYATRGADCFQVDSVWCDGEPLAWSVDARRAVDYARSIGWRSGEARGLIWLGLHLAALGDYRPALECARDGLAIAVDDRQVRYESTAHILYAAVWLDVLDLDQAIEHGQQGLGLARTMRSATVAATAASFVARTQIAAGRLGDATATLDQTDAVARNSMPHRLLESAGAELLLARREFTAALGRVGGLVDAAPHAGHGQVIPRLWHLRGLALSGLGRSAEADDCLAEGASAANRLRQRPVLWRTLVSAGTAMHERGAQATADECYRSARRIIDELGTGLADTGAGSAFVAAATRALPKPTRRSGMSPQLTAREREVAALVSQGMTNRNIANHLVLSTRTVEKHVANALMKLHMRSRVELAVWAASNAP